MSQAVSILLRTRRPTRKSDFLSSLIRVPLVSVGHFVHAQLRAVEHVEL